MLIVDSNYRSSDPSMTLDLESGRKVFRCEDGYLSCEVGFLGWDEAVGEAIAKEENVKMSEAHWEVVDFLRGYYEEYRIAPMIRILGPSARGWGKRRIPNASMVCTLEEDRKPAKSRGCPNRPSLASLATICCLTSGGSLLPPDSKKLKTIRSFNDELKICTRRLPCCLVFGKRVLDLIQCKFFLYIK